MYQGIVISGMEVLVGEENLRAALPITRLKLEQVSPIAELTSLPSVLPFHKWVDKNLIDKKVLHGFITAFTQLEISRYVLIKSLSGVLFMDLVNELFFFYIFILSRRY